jgi:hypothetical protein
MAKRIARPGFVGQAEYAKRRNVSRQYIHQLIKEGVISITSDGLIDPDRADLELAAISDPSRASKKTPLSVGGDEFASNGLSAKELNEKLLIARIERETEQAKKLKLERGKLEGRLVERQDVRDATFRRATEEQKALLNWPMKIAPLMAAELRIDSEKLRKKLDKAVREFLRGRSLVRIPDVVDDGENDD